MCCTRHYKDFETMENQVETVKMIDMWLKFKNSQPCTNAPNITIAEVLSCAPAKDNRISSIPVANGFRGSSLINFSSAFSSNGFCQYCLNIEKLHRHYCLVLIFRYVYHSKIRSKNYSTFTS